MPRGQVCDLGRWWVAPVIKEPRRAAIAETAAAAAAAAATAAAAAWEEDPGLYAATTMNTVTMISPNEGGDGGGGGGDRGSGGARKTKSGEHGDESRLMEMIGDIVGPEGILDAISMHAQVIINPGFVGETFGMFNTSYTSVHTHTYTAIDAPPRCIACRQGAVEEIVKTGMM